MKVRIAFIFSKEEKELRLRVLKWKWRLPLDELSFKDILQEVLDELENKKQPKSDEQLKKSNRTKIHSYRFFIRVFLYPETRTRIWKFIKKMVYRSYKLFSLRFEGVEVKGTLGDPFYDSMALGFSGGWYYPHWEDENGSWSAKGEVILKTGFLRGSLFLFSLIYQTSALTFVLWRGLRRARRAVQ